MRVFLLLVLCCSSSLRPDAERSEVTCGPCEARADDFARVRVKVLLRDVEGAPVRGQRVLFGSTDCAVTDAQGAAAATFSSQRAGPREVQVRLPDGRSVGSVAVAFYAGSFPRADFSTP